jgi:hypothetical protein
MSSADKVQLEVVSPLALRMEAEQLERLMGVLEKQCNHLNVLVALTNQIRIILQTQSGIHPAAQ